MKTVILEDHKETRRKLQENIGIREHVEQTYYPGCFGFPKQKTVKSFQYFDKDKKVWKEIPKEYKSNWIN